MESPSSHTKWCGSQQITLPSSLSNGDTLYTKIRRRQHIHMPQQQQAYKNVLPTLVLATVQVPMRWIYASWYPSSTPALPIHRLRRLSSTRLDDTIRLNSTATTSSDTKSCDNDGNSCFYSYTRPIWGQKSTQFYHPIVACCISERLVHHHPLPHHHHLQPTVVLVLLVVLLQQRREWQQWQQ